MKSLLVACLLLPVIATSYPLTNCTSQCSSSNNVTALTSKAPLSQHKYLLCACRFGCRINILNHVMYQTQDCNKSCKDAYNTQEEQLSCSVGCNLNANEDTYICTNETYVSFITVIYQTVILSIDSFWAGTDTKSEDAPVVYYVFQKGVVSDQDSTTTTGNTEATAATGEDSAAIQLWLVIQVLCAFLLLLSLLCCCCMCSGEARNYGNKKPRPREIANCKEEKEKLKYKLMATPPITTYTVPVKLGGPL